MCNIIILDDISAVSVYNIIIMEASLLIYLMSLYCFWISVATQLKRCGVGVSSIRRTQFHRNFDAICKELYFVQTNQQDSLMQLK